MKNRLLKYGLRSRATSAPHTLWPGLAGDPQLAAGKVDWQDP